MCWQVTATSSCEGSETFYSAGYIHHEVAKDVNRWLRHV